MTTLPRLSFASHIIIPLRQEVLAFCVDSEDDLHSLHSLVPLCTSPFSNFLTLREDPKAHVIIPQLPGIWEECDRIKRGRIEWTLSQMLWSFEAYVLK